jgi:hypothetical protein
MLQVRPVALICDLHGHSRREGVFTYSCLPDKQLLPVNQEVPVEQVGERRRQGGGGALHTSRW